MTELIDLSSEIILQEETAAWSLRTLSVFPKGTFSWTRHKIVTLASLCLVYVLLYGAVAVLQPFYPTEASGKGVSETVVGFLFATYPLVAFTVAPLFGMLIPIYGPRFILLSGCFLGGGSMVLFGFCDKMPGKTLFTAFSFLLRLSFAVGGVACETSVISILIEEFSGTPGIATGILETFAGVGYCVGPVVGGILYTAGGFMLPFLVLGATMVACIPVLIYTLANLKVHSTENSNPVEEPSPSMLQALKIPGVFMLALSFITSGIIIGFVEPVLGPHLKQQMDLNAVHIGLVFLISAGVYAILSPVIGWIGDKTQWYRQMIMAGFVAASVAYLLLGPAPFFAFILPKRKVWLPCVAMAAHGVSCGLFFVSLMPDLINTARIRGLPDSLSSSGVLSGIFSSMTNLGLTIGPSIAGVLVERYAFQWATTIAASIFFVQAFLLTVFTLYEAITKRRRVNGLTTIGSQIQESTDD